MAQVFVSYAQKDMVEARRILEALEQAGLSVFRETSLAAGVSWADDVRHQIDTAKCVVVLWSQAAAESQFVQQEVAQAIQAWSDGRLVLAVLDETELPRGLGDLPVTRLGRDAHERDVANLAEQPLELGPHCGRDDVLAQLAGAFEELRLRRQREAAERKRQWKIAEDRRRAEMEQKRETIRFRRLIAYCDDWRTAADIRGLAAAVEASPLASTEKFGVWKSWALDHANRLDPLRNDSLFDWEVTDHEVYSLRD
jgi:hypothetical protein